MENVSYRRNIGEGSFAYDGGLVGLGLYLWKKGPNTKGLGGEDKNGGKKIGKWRSTTCRF